MWTEKQILSVCRPLQCTVLWRVERKNPCHSNLLLPLYSVNWRSKTTDRQKCFQNIVPLHWNLSLTCKYRKASCEFETKVQTSCTLYNSACSQLLTSVIPLPVRNMLMSLTFNDLGCHPQRCSGAIGHFRMSDSCFAEVANLHDFTIRCQENTTKNKHKKSQGWNKEDRCISLLTDYFNGRKFREN